MASRRSLLVLAVTVTSLVVTFVVSVVEGEGLADGLLQEEQSTLVALRSDQVDRYFARLEGQLRALALSQQVGVALDQFGDAHAALGADDVEPGDDLTVFYRDEFAPEAAEALGPSVSWSRLIPETSAAIQLQQAYVAGVPRDERVLRDDAEDGSAWTAVHAVFHPALREVVERLGIVDLYLVDLRSGDVVYSVRKMPDFGTSLETGPYSATTLGSVARRVRSDAAAGVQTTDMTPYVGEAGRPVGFMAAPLTSSTGRPGALVFKFGPGALTEIMTSGRDWESQGLGDAGETFLAGPDGTLRSESRLFIEDPRRYADRVTEAGSADESTVRAVRATGTTVGFQRAVDPMTVGDPSAEPVETTNYLGQKVYASYRPLPVQGLNWVIGVERDRTDVEGPLVAFRRALLIAVTLFVTAITFVTVAWSRRVFAPLRTISERLTSARVAGETDPGSGVTDETPREFADLSEAIDEMLAESSARQRDIRSAADERLTTMRELLPPGVADRVEAGDRGALDDVPRATVVVVTVTGLGSLLPGDAAHGGRQAITELTARLDALAAEHGLDPVKLVGDSYFAGCGLSRPFLDHVPRAVSFALRARETVQALDSLTVSCGLATGPVTVGLAGSAGLVYDVWGSTVDAAALLARVAMPDRILVSRETSRVLPEDVTVRATTGTQQGDAEAVEIVGRRTAARGATDG